MREHLEGVARFGVNLCYIAVTGEKSYSTE
jgi:hypothetical protein